MVRQADRARPDVGGSKSPHTLVAGFFREFERDQMALGGTCCLGGADPDDRVRLDARDIRGPRQDFRTLQAGKKVDAGRAGRIRDRRGIGAGAVCRDLAGRGPQAGWSGSLTAGPLILLFYASRRITMATSGLVQYLNPTPQFLCAVVVFQEPFTGWHGLAFGLIWLAPALYSAEVCLRTRRCARRLPRYLHQ